MLSEAYFNHFAPHCAERFSKMATVMGGIDFIEELMSLQDKCKVRNLKMSDYGIEENELEAMVDNAFDTMGFLCDFDPVALTKPDALSILRKAYK